MDGAALVADFVAFVTVEVTDRAVCEVVVVTLFFRDLSGRVPASVVSGNASSSPSAARSPAAVATKRRPYLRLASTFSPFPSVASVPSAWTAPGGYRVALPIT